MRGEPSIPRTTPESAVPRAMSGNGPVPDGIEFHARTLTAYGGLAALVPMAGAGVLGSLVLWNSQSAIRGILGFALAIVSCPTLPLFGLPVTNGSGRWLGAIATSAVLWFGVGTLAARRSTVKAVAGWREWRREWLRLATGTWIGAFVGFAIAAIVLTVDF